MSEQEKTQPEPRRPRGRFADAVVAEFEIRLRWYEILRAIFGRKIELKLLVYTRRPAGPDPVSSLEYDMKPLGRKKI